VSLIVGIASFATAAGSLSMEGAKASPSPAMVRSSQQVETAFASFSLQSAESSSATPQRDNACGDITSFFLHESCSTLHKRRFARVRRPLKTF
jgi:hypothetical protein